MRLDRRSLLLGAAATSMASAVPLRAFAEAVFAPRPTGWRTFEVVTRVELVEPRGRAYAWIPVPSVNEASWARSGESTWTTNAPAAALKREPEYGAAMVHAEWHEGGPAPVIEVTSRFSTRDRSTDIRAANPAAALSEAERALYTKSTELIPVDGLTRTTAEAIVSGETSDAEKARRIYDWVVDNTFRDPKTRGCGIGDVASMLKTNNLSGKCADLNALYVGLARAAGLPARDVYGIRVAPSKFGYKSLGAGSEKVTKSQHCRAEVYLDGLGWVPVDPADVRKVALEEPPANLEMTDPKVVAARAALFGAWEGNWLAYNFAHDLALPGSDGPKVGFLMYPQAEVAGERLDPLDPDNFRYTITAREVTGG